jgi:flagellar M-ring protein FliF
VRANVTADIDFNQVEQMEENFDPKSAVVRSQQTSQEYKNSPSGSGGVAGTRANDPTAPAETKTTGSAAGNGRTATTTTYEISKVTKRTVANGGRVTRLSVSVLVDSNLPMEGVETGKIQELVTAAIGIDKARGDVIAVQMIPFQQPVLIETPPNMSWLERNREIVKTGIKYGVLVFVALLLMIMVVRPARRALKQAGTPKGQLLLPPADDQQHYLPASQMDTPRTVAELEAAVEAESVVKADPVVVALSRPKETAATVRRNQVVGYSKDEPEKVAMAVRNWLQKS